MKDQEEADADRQLALYSIWVKDKFKDAKSVKLVWHMLAFNKDAVSERSDEQLEKLQGEVIEKIKEIENATEFPRRQTALCNYCGFKSECPSFKHEVELEGKDVKKFKEDEGVVLVDEFSEVKTGLGELKKKQEEFKGKLIGYSKQFGVDVVYGSNKKCSVKEFEKVVLPEDREEFVKMLKDKGLWEELSMVCYPKLNSQVMRGALGGHDSGEPELDEDIKKMIGIEKDWRLSLSGRKE